MAKTEKYFGKVLMPERASRRKNREKSKDVTYKHFV